MNRAFKGIWIPKEIWLSRDLTTQEKLFLVEIDSLDNENGCTAGNAYFADFFQISKTRVSLVISNLIDKGYIKSSIVYKDGSKQILYRVLNICCPPYPTYVNEGMQQKLYTPIQQKLKDNNTSNNNSDNNLNNKKEDKPPTNFKNSILETIIQTSKDLGYSEDMKQALLDYAEYRKQLKKPLTEMSLKKLINKLNGWGYSEKQKIQAIDNAISNGWQGVFELNEKQNKQQKSSNPFLDMLKNGDY